MHRKQSKMNMNIRILNDVAVPTPPIEEQHEIVRCVEALFKLADTKAAPTSPPPSSSNVSRPNEGLTIRKDIGR